MSKDMLIDSAHAEEIRIAVVDDGREVVARTASAGRCRLVAVEPEREANGEG